MSCFDMFLEFPIQKKSRHVQLTVSHESIVGGPEPEKLNKKSIGLHTTLQLTHLHPVSLSREKRYLIRS